jgi:hypothetical protein
MQTPNDQKSEPTTGHSVEKLAKLICIRVHSLQYHFDSTDLGPVGEIAPGPNKGKLGKVNDPRPKAIRKHAAQTEKAKAEKEKAKKARALSRAKAAKAWVLARTLARASPRSLARNTKSTAKYFVELLLLFCSPFVNPHAKVRLLALVNEVVKNGFKLSALIDPNYVVEHLLLFQRLRDPESLDGAMRDLIGKIKALIPGSELFLEGQSIFNRVLGPKGQRDALTAHIAALAIPRDIDTDKFLKLVLADLSRMMGVIRAYAVKKILDDFLMEINRKEFLLVAGLETRQARMAFEREGSTPKAITVHESLEAADNREEWAKYEFGRAYDSDRFDNTAGNVPEEAEYPPPWAANERRRHREFIRGEQERQIEINRALAKESAEGFANGAWFR